MATCVVSGTFLDPSEVAIAGATVTFKIDNSFIGNTADIIAPKNVSTTTAANGTWSLTLTRSSSGTITLSCPPDANNPVVRYSFAVVVPDAATATFNAVWADPTNFTSPTNFPLDFTLIAGSIDATNQIDDGSIVNAKLANMANNTIKGNKSGGAAAPSDVALGSLTEATSSVLTISGSNTVVGNTTIQVKEATTTQSGYLSSTDWNTFNGKQDALGFTPENSANKDQINGYPSLDGSGLIPTAEIPDLAASTILVEKIGSATYGSVQDVQNVFHSAGWVSGGAITDNGDGTVDVAAGTGAIRTTASPTGILKFFDWAASTGLALADNDNNFIYVDYNSGAPVVVVNTSTAPDRFQYIDLGQAFRNGTEVHINSATKQTIGDHAGLMVQYNKEVMPYAHASGAIISETGTRNISVTAGVFWEGLTRFTTAAFDSSGTDTFSYYHRSSTPGEWVETPAQTQINNTQYDNGSGTLQTLTNNHYAIGWVYQETDSNIVVLYGQGDYILNDAVAAMPPASVPDRIDLHGYLIGKIVLQKGASAFTDINSAFEIMFQPMVAANHNELGGLQGGAADEYYHLTNAQNADVANATDANTASTFVKRDASGNFSAGTITAALTGTASGNTTYTANQYGVVLSGSGNAMVVLAPNASTTKVLTSGGSSANPTWSDPPSGTAETVVASQTGAYNATTADGLVPCNANGGGFTVTLYAASGNSGKRIKIIKTDSSFNAVTIDGNASETINGALTILLATQYECVELECDGSNWFILNRRTNVPWTSYTPTLTGFGTPSNVTFFWRRVGENLEINGRFTAGTVTATEARLSFPSGLTSQSTSTFPTTICVAGQVTRSAVTADQCRPLLEPGVTYWTLGVQSSSSESNTKRNASTIFNNSETITISAKAPISGWEA